MAPLLYVVAGLIVLYLLVWWTSSWRDRELERSEPENDLPPKIIEPDPQPDQQQETDMAANVKVYDIRNDLTRHATKRYGRRGLGQIETLIVHHSATTSGSATAFARYHVNNLGWPGIAYHYVIDKDGRINQTQDLETISWHVSGQNTRAVGVCCVGHYDQQTPPRAQLDSLVLLLKALKTKLPGVEIRGHRDYSAKTCPGNNFPLEEVVRKVNSPTTNTPGLPTSGNGTSVVLALLPIGAALLWYLNK